VALEGRSMVCLAGIALAAADIGGHLMRSSWALLFSVTAAAVKE
jgi:hypothetical protein